MSQDLNSLTQEKDSMTSDQKYHVRIVCDGGNAFEGITYMTDIEFEDAINRPDKDGWCRFAFINDGGLLSSIRVDRAWIRGWMHQLPQTLATVQRPRAVS